MKRILFLLTCLIGVLQPIFSQEYYWYKGKQIPLRRGNQKYILYEESNKKSAPLKVIEGGEISCSKTNSVKWGIIGQETIIDNAKISYHTPSFLCSDTTKNMFITHRFYVKLKSPNDLTLLQNLLKQYHAEIEKEGDLPLWYVIRCDLNSQHNALDLANRFYESGLFAVSEPEFIHATQIDCVNDSKFNKQWNLKNTGQWLNWNNVDINYCVAHAVTTGNSSVIIGVYDLGVELTHPDINLCSFSYDVETLSSPSQIYTINNNNYHGTACAGIIGAKTDNNLGVAGIASTCPVMSISFDEHTNDYNIGLGFKIAADNGCSVISNSWNRSSYSEWIDECILYALTNGRNGKGCVIVFSAGNGNTNNINYPASSNDSIIVVGAMSPCGERCNPYSCDGENWGSNYGNKLDVMAPGVKIPSTDRVGTNGQDPTDYMENFNGTSAACPHVAAVAGLILSVNPYLTQKEVADIIESTAQKIGSGYNQNPNRPNGTWNNGMGYGLVDAYAAVLEAKNRLPNIQGPDYICTGDTVCYHLLNMPEEATCNWTIYNLVSKMGIVYKIIQGQGTPTIYVTRENVDQHPVIPITRMGESSIYENYSGIILPQFQLSDYIKATITMSDNTTYTVTKKIHSAKGRVPTIESSATTPWESGQTRHFTITNNTDAPGDELLWEFMDVLLMPDMEQNDTTYSYFSGRTVAYTPYVAPNYLRSITITATNTFEACEEQSSSIIMGVSNTSMLLSVSVDNNQMNISILQGADDFQNRSAARLNENSSYTLELNHSIYGNMRVQPVYSTTEQVPISGLPSGVYVLSLRENGNIVAQTKINL